MIAELIQVNEGLTCVQRRHAILNLLSLCRRNYTTIYRPGEEPTEQDSCPVCLKKMKEYATNSSEIIQFMFNTDNSEANKHGLKPRSRSDHIHRCRRQEMAKELGYNERGISYCYDCFKWEPKENWSEHCATFDLKT